MTRITAIAARRRIPPTLFSHVTFCRLCLGSYHLRWSQEIEARSAWLLIPDNRDLTATPLGRIVAATKLRSQRTPWIASQFHSSASNVGQTKTHVTAKSSGLR